MTEVERVARAICLASFDGLDPDEIRTHKPPPYCCEPTSTNPDDEEYMAYDEDAQESFFAWKLWRLYARQARAALEAMREPTEEMLKPKGASGKQSA